MTEITPMILPVFPDSFRAIEIICMSSCARGVKKITTVRIWILQYSTVQYSGVVHGTRTKYEYVLVRSHFCKK